MRSIRLWDAPPDTGSKGSGQCLSHCIGKQKGKPERGFFTAAGILIGFGGFLLAVFWGIRTGLAPLTVASLVLMCGGWLHFWTEQKAYETDPAFPGI